MNTPIIFICDNDNLLALSVSLYSLSIHASTPFKVYIITNSLLDENIKRIKYAKFNNLLIDYIDATEILNRDFKQPLNNGYIPKTALLKFYIPELMPTYDKALYLDTDIIIKKDLHELLNIDLNDCYVAAVKNIVVPNRKQKDIVHKNGYFNSGVMFMNLDLMRKNNISKKLIETKKNYCGDNYMDQSVFNIVLKNKVKYLPLKYNYLQIYDLHPLKFLNYYYKSNYKNNPELENDIYILHLAGHYKPWKYIEGYSYPLWIKMYNNTPLKFKVDLENRPLVIKRIFKYIKKVRFANIDIFFVDNLAIFAIYHNLIFPFFSFVLSKNKQLGFRNKQNYNLCQIICINR